MKILSLFYGMACGRIAAERAGFNVEKYYAAEIDKHAMKVAKDNYPDIVHLGDITQWKEWDIDWASIDLLIGGSPCQGFSFSGKQLAFDDPRSKLFFTYVDIKNHIDAQRQSSGFKPVKFLLENVKMKKEFLAEISRIIGVEPEFINSKVISAQSRPRYYWFNWAIDQPEDKGVLVQDILQEECDIDAKYTVGKGQLKRLKESTDVPKKFSVINPEKAITMTARQYANWKGNFIKIGAMIGRRINPSTGRRDDYNKSIPIVQRVEIRADDKRGTLTTVQKDNLVCNNEQIRRLTPIECERLQTVPDNYTKQASDTQRYKMLGNGWTVDVIAHIFSQIEM